MRTCAVMMTADKLHAKSSVVIKSPSAKKYSVCRGPWQADGSPIKNLKEILGFCVYNCHLQLPIALTRFAECKTKAQILVIQ